MRNIALHILESCDRHSPRVAMRHKSGDDWASLTYGEMAKRIDRLAASLVDLGVAPGDRVGIYSTNRPEWLLADYAVMSISGVTVPIYATSTAEQLAAIVVDAGLRILFTGSEVEYAAACDAFESCPTLELVIAIDPLPENAPVPSRWFEDLFTGEPEQIITNEVVRRRQGAALTDLATIIYTSGTTGEPKGVMLSHANFVNQLSSVDSRFDIDETDRSLCFLPLSHVYERTWSAFVFCKGSSNSILSNPRQVVAALAEVRPTMMVSAPRLYEKAHSAILARVAHSPRWRQRLFDWALASGEVYWSRRRADRRPGIWCSLRYRLADGLALRKIRNAMGGPKKCLSSGGAPLNQDVEEFFLKIGLLISQGYGLTETAPMLTCNNPGDYRLGTVGKPVDDVEIRIADSGEIEVRGPNVTSGYYRNPAATSEAFNADWFRTGDIGHLDEDGFLVITDRIKDLIITAGGKNVAPQRIESLVGKDYYIDQMAVVGDKRKFISAIVVPAFEALSEFAAEKKLQFSNHEELIKLPEVMELYTRRIKEQSQSLAPFEKIKRFTLVAKQFSMQTGEITPTLKVRRQVIMQKYRDLIERMYPKEASAHDHSGQ